MSIERGKGGHYDYLLRRHELYETYSRSYNKKIKNPFDLHLQIILFKQCVLLIIVPGNSNNL